MTYTETAQDYPIGSTRFMAMMQTNGHYKPLHGTGEQANEPEPLANEASNEKATRCCAEGCI